MFRAEIDETGRIGTKYLYKKIITVFLEKMRPVFQDQECYYAGENPAIFGRSSPKTKDVPDNRIPISYGRKIIKTISGYMFKPGLITYDIENTADKDNLNELYMLNDEPILNNKLGTYMSINGITFELHYFKDNNANLEYRMTMVKAADGIPIYNYDIDPVMMAFIRIYMIGDEQLFEVYYPMEIVTYKFNANKNDLEVIDSNVNVFKQVPIVIYENGINQLSDICPIKELIDANDVLASDSMNEFDRFAFAYLKLVGQGLTEDDAEEIKRKRIFEHLENKDAVGFLTKDIPTEFITLMKGWIKSEIHAQSMIPDVSELNFTGGASGVAISKFIYLLEYIAGDKEAYFKEGVSNRLNLVNLFRPIQDPEGIRMVFTRNVPASAVENAKNYTLYFGKGITTPTLISEFAPFVDDPDAEYEAFKEEAESVKDFEVPELIEEEDEEEDEQGT